MSRRVNPNVALDQVTDRESFYKFVLALAEDREESVAMERANPISPYSSDANGWENVSIEGFLSSAVNCARDADGCWIDMAGDHAGATMLAQIMYWCFIPNKETGKIKLTIKKHGSSWLAKSDREWWEECRLTRSQVDRILAQFREVGWIETRVMRFNGSPTTHIRALWPLLHSW